MKTLYSLIPLTLVIFFNSCSFDENHLSPDGAVSISLEVLPRLSIVRSRTSSEPTDFFRITILNEDLVPVLVYPKFSDLPPSIPLKEGIYYFAATLNDSNSVSWDSPHLSGLQGPIAISPATETEVVISCRYQNAMVIVRYDSLVTSNFDTYQTVVSNEDGSLTFTESETRTGYFSKKAITINSTLGITHADGTVSQYTVDGTIPEPAAATIYQVSIQGFEPSGSSTIGIDIVEDIDTINIDLGVPQSPSGIEYGTILLTELMPNPEALSDSEGEWMELYNNSSDTIDLYNLVLKKASGSAHTINEHIQMLPQSYFALAKSETALAGPKYVYSSISLGNSSDNIGIYNFGTDGTNGSLISELNYDNTFPYSSGTAMQLSADRLDISFLADPSNWCSATDSYSTGDLGTPGTANVNCN